MTVAEVDLSYKKNALRNNYDIEATRDLFTLAIVNDYAFTLMFFGTEQFDAFSDEELTGYMHSYANRRHIRKILKKKPGERIQMNLLRYRTGSDEDMKRLSRDLNTIISCKPLDVDRPHAEALGNLSFSEYCGYNSGYYDLTMMILVRLLLNKKKGRVTPSDIRDLSNILIGYRGVPWRLAEHIEEETHSYIKQQQIQFEQRRAAWADGHIDWTRVMRMSDDDTDTVPASLKAVMSNMGLDIIIDEDVSYDGFKTYTQKDMQELIEYNFNDVIGTKLYGELPGTIASLEVRDTIRELYPYTSARFVRLGDLRSKRPEDRDVTTARLTQLVLVGPKKIKPVDSRTIEYGFPVPKDGNLDDMHRVPNFWEYMKQKEEFVPPHLDQFFTYYHGKDVSTKDLNRKVNQEQPVNGSSVMHVPYYRDGKPVNAFVDVSTGGAHGGVMVGLRHYTDAMVTEWIKTSRKLKDHEKSTIDEENVIHMDYVSFYPVNQSKLGAYITREKIDRYTDIITKRIQTKAEQKKHKRYSAEWWRLEKLQLGYKLLLNSATGAGNLRQAHALLPLDNKTTAMRLIGNMLIWSLSQRITQAGGFVVSTNTDGIYIVGMTMEEVQPIVDRYIADYGVIIEPELVKRFINRDVSTRVELEQDAYVVDRASGDLKHGANHNEPLRFKEDSLKGVPYPLICADAVLHYMVSDKDWLRKPYDPSVIRRFIEDELASDDFKPTAWWHTYVGSSTRRLVVEGRDAQKVNRIFLTKDGHHITAKLNRQLSGTEPVEMWNQIMAGETDLSRIRFSREKKVSWLGWQETVEDEEPLEFDRLLVEQGIEGTEFDFVRSYKPYKTAKTQYIPLGVKKQVFAEDDLDAFRKEKGYNNLGYYNKQTETWETVKRWKIGKMSGYTSNIGTICNLYEEVEAFDKSQIDVDAYVRWSENALTTWKVTGDLPEISMMAVDDTIIPTERKIRRTKKDDAIDMIREIYGLMDMETAEDDEVAPMY